MMSIIFLVDQMFKKRLHQLEKEAELRRMLINSRITCRIFISLSRMWVYKKPPLNFLRSGQCLLLRFAFATNRKRSTSILIASILHGHFDFLAGGLPFQATHLWLRWQSSMRWPEISEHEWLSVWHSDVSCLSVFELTSNAAVQTYADVFVSSQLVVGKDQPKEWFL